MAIPGMTASISVGVLFAMSALSALHAAQDWGKLVAVRPLPDPVPFAEGGVCAVSGLQRPYAGKSLPLVFATRPLGTLSRWRVNVDGHLIGARPYFDVASGRIKLISGGMTIDFR